eukprot:14755514-Ditylum_brightwellii.AAC.1
MHKGKVKASMWDDKRQSCTKWHHVESCTEDCGRKYSNCTEILAKAKRDHNRFIKECVMY